MDQYLLNINTNRYSLNVMLTQKNKLLKEKIIKLYIQIGTQ